MAVLAAWETVPSRPGTGVLHRPDIGAPCRAPARRPSDHQARPGRLVAVAEPAPRVAACRRVFRRRRLAGLLVGVAVVAGIVVGLSQLASAANGPAVPERTTVVQVAPGETLWQLAERVAPGSPPQQVVERIRELNGMHGSTIHPGQPLIVPDATP
jgi:hypothetical protein